MRQSRILISQSICELIFLIQTIFTSFLYDVALFMWLDVVDEHSGGCDSSKETNKNYYNNYEKQQQQQQQQQNRGKTGNVKESASARDSA